MKLENTTPIPDEKVNKMRRKEDILLFYELLENLRKKVGGYRYLVSSHGRMNWPRQGVYFFLEETEFRENSNAPRVVRIGTHAVSKGSKSVLWKSLYQHRGPEGGNFPGGGSHRSSKFRENVGFAVMKKEGLSIPTWGISQSVPKRVLEAEYELEVFVSDYIGKLPFLWLDVEGPGQKFNIRSTIHKYSISLLSNLIHSPINPPTKFWLGQHSPNNNVKNSGLWNAHATDTAPVPDFLPILEKYVANMEAI